MKIVIENRSSLPIDEVINCVGDVALTEMSFIKKYRKVGCRLEDSLKAVVVSVYPINAQYPEDVLAFLVKDVGKKKTRKAGLK